MMTQKVVIVLMIICLAFSVASIIKFAERKQLTSFSLLTSMFMPIFHLIFMVYFFLYVYRRDFRLITFPDRFFCAIKFVFIELQIIPLIHTTVIDMFCCLQKEERAKVIFFNFKKSTVPARLAIENLHGRIVNSFA